MLFPKGSNCVFYHRLNRARAGQSQDKRVPFSDSGATREMLPVVTQYITRPNVAPMAFKKKAINASFSLDKTSVCVIF
jgi:hypothetical protein